MRAFVVVAALLAPCAAPCALAGARGLTLPAPTDSGSRFVAPVPRDAAPAAAPAAELPSGVPANWWTAASAAIRAEEYHASWQSPAPFADLDAGWQAPNRAHDFRAWFTPEGVRLVPRRDAAPAWEWSVALVAWGRPGARREPGPARLSVAANRVDADRGELVEWFVNDERGLEQGFTIATRPEGEGPLVLDLALGGTLSADLAEDGQAADFTDATGARVLHYGALSAADAGGANLAARLEAFCAGGRCGMRIVVDDAGAVYPVTVDPLATTAAWFVDGGQPHAMLGYSVAPAGDVNADGYDDVVVGVPYWDWGVANSGRALVFLGRPSGLPATPSQVLVGQPMSESFGYSVATAGDFNDDGYSDIVVGAPDRSGGGGADVWCGRPGSGSLYHCWSAQGQQAGGRFGYRVSTAGDVSGDGVSDIMVDEPLFEHDGIRWAGRVSIYFGHAGVPDPVEDWWVQSTLSHPFTGFEFGRGLGPAGDVNGDGFSDVLISDPQAGSVYVVYGSASGPSDAIFTGHVADSAFGWSALAAGDLDGDGYGDVAVGAPQASNGGFVRIYRGRAEGLLETFSWDIQHGGAFGAAVGTAGDVNGDGYADLLVTASATDTAYLFEGGPSGPGTVEDWSTDYPGADWGFAMATAGDVNGDGFSDVIVGAPKSTALVPEDGRAVVFLGGADGLRAVESWTTDGNNAGAEFGYSVASAGDVNGDGFSDVVVGAVLYDEGQTNEGKVFVFCGSDTGLPAAANWTATSNQAEARMGYSVASAGDVNGDGYSDIIVGARGYADPDTDEGAAFVWYGSASGLGAAGTPANADWRAEGNQASAYFGIAVASAGDVNGDGYGDVIVGASLYDQGLTDGGAAFVWHGSATGLGAIGTPANADWKAYGTQASSRFGAAVAGAGDVNDDGWGDILVGAYMYDGTETNEGRACAWYGSSAGLGPSNRTADWTADGGQATGYFGFSLAWAGDVNGDGYSDVAVGSYLWDWGDTIDQGRVLVYHGSASGLPAAATYQLQGNLSDEYFGRSVACAGDVDGDGYADLVVGSPAYGDADKGAASIWYGGATGLSAHSYFVYAVDGDQFGYSVAGAGDVNGDGYADVIAGSPFADSPDSAEGRASVFLGNSGRSRMFKPGQSHGSGAGLALPRLGRSNDDYYVRFTGRAYGLLGRARFTVDAEVKGSHHPFNGFGVTKLAGEYDTYTAGHDFTARPQVGSGLQHWRMRPLFRASDSPFQRHGHVYQPPWAGANEGDFRTVHDTDGDGLTDEMDNCPEAYNPSQSDADADGTGNDCDLCTDTDHDGRGNPGYPINTCDPDNCPDIANGGQEDADNDGVGDACDTCTDTDRDGFGNPGYVNNTCATDNCPTVVNADQADGDGDGVGNACDNCLGYANPGQEDFDDDGWGDVCDPCTDTDGDGRANPGFPRSTCGLDNCPIVPNPTQLDSDRDGSGDACDDCTDQDGDGFGMPDPQLQTCPPDNCYKAYNPGQEDADHDGSGDVCDKCTDSDGDLYGDPGFPVNTCPQDCRPADATIWSAPSEVFGLLLTKAPGNNITWSPPANPGATTIAYDVLTSRVANDWGLFEATCVESDGIDAAASEPSIPLAGHAYYYLVRAEGPCGSNLGADSNGVPRTGRNCP